VVVGSGVLVFHDLGAGSGRPYGDRGEHGKIVYATFEAEPLRVETDEGVQEYRFEAPGLYPAAVDQTVVDELLGRGSCPSTGVTGARTTWLMESLVSRRE
jgi:hypothetical protein